MNIFFENNVSFSRILFADVFLGQIHADNGDALNSASLSLDSWKAISDSDMLRELGVQRPLLQSTVDIKKSIDDLNNYMKTLPLYSEHFLTMICSMVMQYKVLRLFLFEILTMEDMQNSFFFLIGNLLSCIQRSCPTRKRRQTDYISSMG